jgi:hypothetical protein
VLIGVAVGAPTPTGIEGAYFTRASGTPTFSSVVKATGLHLFDAGDGNLWIGGGLVCVMQALAVAAFVAVRRRTA